MTEEQEIPEHYNVVLSGRIKQGFERDSVIQQVAQLFNSPAEKVEHLFSDRANVIKSNLSHKKAYQYRQRLQQIGAEVSLQRVATQQPDKEFTLVPEGEEQTPYEELAKRQQGGEKVECQHCHTEQTLAPFCTECGKPLRSSADEKSAPGGASLLKKIAIGLSILLVTVFGLIFFDVVDISAW